ncbi:tyrosine kinase domain protein [Rhizoctonia solani AG-3 Rhs1AP]|uniref:Tyrosine kinase domain protein n=1 Tax=Rhizoctonia solani AG-3 Rhs1AP TaxID=1086054 RepID=X8JIZ9_9AGAM|nr:tyrosine kinase domain protein [Rhizoctonia solani AG-3 Rhs1AP]
MWTIHHPKPRTASPQTFNFLDDPPGPGQSQLPTPSSTPEPKSSTRRLSIPDLVSNDTHFGKINTLQTAVDTFERATLPGGAVLTFDQAGEGEYLLSAKPWEVDECRRVNQELWDRLEGHVYIPSAPVCTPAVQPAALTYLTPPSSPEPIRKRRLAPIEHSDPPNVPEPPTPSDCANLLSASPENLEYLSDYEDEWAVESVCSDSEELPLGLINRSDCPNDDDSHNSTHSFSPSDVCDISYLEKSIMGISTHSEELGIKATHPGELGIKDLTPQLDNSCFSEWPIARGGFGEIWKGALTRGRPIAVKRLTMYSAAGDEGAKKIRKRTTRELAIWSRLKHPNILPLMGTCSFRGSMSLVSEWQDNGNATEWVRANPGVDRLELVCLAVVIENLKLMDRHILQGNVMISKKGRPRLIDFGLASITDNSLFSASSTLAGTLRWMAPELQVTEGQGTTKAGDMFAFGMVSSTSL